MKSIPKGTIFGHPSGLFTLFFAEMWERFSYYGMRSLLVFYMIKGFLGYNDSKAYAIYGAYTALVYATPFIGGMLADRLLGARKSVVIGGILMSMGHLLMTVEMEWVFMAGLAFLIAGNGFFKPNISTIVGQLYEEMPKRRDSGFTLFYMGINLGAAMSPLICGYVGEMFGWHYGFGLATAGMMLGLAVFTLPRRVAQFLILIFAFATAGLMISLQSNTFQLVVNSFVSLGLLVAGGVAFAALGRGGLPKGAGEARSPEAAKRKVLGVVRADWAVYIGIGLAIPILMLLVARNTVTGWILAAFGLAAFVWLIVKAARSALVERHRLFVILILMFFSMLFWSFFEQAGSSITNFTDRNVDRVFEETTVTEDMVGKTAPIELNQEQLGYFQDDTVITLTYLEAEREKAKLRQVDKPIEEWRIQEGHVGMGIGGSEVPASLFQAANPIFILIFGLVFTALWTWLGRRALEPSTPAKFALGLLQLGLGFAALWYGTTMADSRGMVAIHWLLVGYLLHTTGELCLSPVGLSMVTKLAPSTIVASVMGAWFLATAFSNYLAGMIAQLTGVSHGEGESMLIPPPSETVHVYGDTFGTIAATAVVCSLLCFALVPVLKKWMHPEVE
ncbi:MAG: peptide MFS transporter [Deltaproteobacteria bacterium]|nr:peptide MFS transporter [Deltaproteobacteria bacterium]MBN2670705.1 peptide MFS transporter [Deltaproteobacteria bacterium]